MKNRGEKERRGFSNTGRKTNAPADGKQEVKLRTAINGGNTDRKLYEAGQNKVFQGTLRNIDKEEASRLDALASGIPPHAGDVKKEMDTIWQQTLEEEAKVNSRRQGIHEEFTKMQKTGEMFNLDNNEPEVPVIEDGQPHMKISHVKVVEKTIEKTVKTASVPPKKYICVSKPVESRKKQSEKAKIVANAGYKDSPRPGMYENGYAAPIQKVADFIEAIAGPVEKIVKEIKGIAEDIRQVTSQPAQPVEKPDEKAMELSKCIEKALKKKLVLYNEKGRLKRTIL